jgi:hypothetical protein
MVRNDLKLCGVSSGRGCSEEVNMLLGLGYNENSRLKR